jgi:hemoglobin-like flavoprotein
MESLIIAAQDQALRMHYYQRNIKQQPIDNKYRMCCKVEEHTKHFVAGCTTLAPVKETNRHNKVNGYSHWTVCKHTGLQVTDRYYEHIPQRVLSTIPLFCGTY